MCVLCVVSLCVMLVLVLVCNVWCVLCVCGVVCVCVVCCLCVARLGTRKTPACRFKTSPYVSSKRIRVYRQNARMLNTCARFAGIHGYVRNLHTETFGAYTRGGGKGGGVVVVVVWGGVGVGVWGWPRLLGFFWRTPPARAKLGFKS